MNVVSEAATNHFGSVPLMWEIIERSLEAGARYVKFQIIDTDALYAKGEYEYGTYDIDAVRWLRRGSAISAEGYRECVQRCREKYGYNAVTATPFDIASIDLLAATDPPFIKIASGDNNYMDLIDAVAGSGFKTILSTGMSDLRQIDDAVNAVLKRTEDLVLMHCVAQYPHDLEDAMLGTIPFLKDRYGVEVGYSDHCNGDHAAVLAASMGVEWFEKHFTLSRTNGGLDAKHSLEPTELAAYCSKVKQAPTAIEGVRSSSSAEEIYTARRARRGIYYRHDLPAGTVLTREQLAFLRPEKEYSAGQAEELMGRRLARAVSEDDPVAAADLESGEG